MSHVTLAEVRQQFTLWRNARQPGSRIPARLWAAAACTALSLRLCRAWDWTQPNGQLKAMVCRGLMLRLHREGYLTLPRSQNSRPGNANTHRIPKPECSILVKTLSDKGSELAAYFTPSYRPIPKPLSNCTLFRIDLPCIPFSPFWLWISWSISIMPKRRRDALFSNPVRRQS